MFAPLTIEIRWRAWALDLFGVVMREGQDGTVELAYRGEHALVRSFDHADACLQFWCARQKIKQAGGVEAQRMEEAQGAAPFRLRLTPMPAGKRQLRLFGVGT